MFTPRPATFPYTLAWAFRSATRKTQNTGVKDKSYLRNARHERDGARDLSRRSILLFPLALAVFTLNAITVTCWAASVTPSAGFRRSDSYFYQAARVASLRQSNRPQRNVKQKVDTGRKQKLSAAEQRNQLTYDLERSVR